MGGTTEKEKVDNFLHDMRMSGEHLRGLVMSREDMIDAITLDVKYYSKNDYVCVIENLAVVTVTRSSS